ncbi:MAG: deoxyribose-phosphate aldolase [Fidelibacterota bacterium]
MSEIKNIASLIDHTLLKPDATREEIRQLCEEARTYGFASVCVNPVHVRFCARELKGGSIPVCTVIGFPLGGTVTAAKVAETREAWKDGAREFDMVLNIGALKEGDLKAVEMDIRRVVEAAAGSVVKVIIEASLLTDQEKVSACRLAEKAGAQFVKTSTGFSAGGATVEDVTLMRNTVGPRVGVKASGGIKTYQDALAMVEAGATRIGASAGVAIVTQQGRAEYD